MIFREGQIKIIKVSYELTDKMGKMLQEEMTAGIAAATPQEALAQLREMINPQAEIRVNQLASSGCIHVITNGVMNMITNKEKNIKTNDEDGKKRAGRPAGSKNKPKE